MKTKTIAFMLAGLSFLGTTGALVLNQIHPSTQWSGMAFFLGFVTAAAVTVGSASDDDSDDDKNSGYGK